MCTIVVSPNWCVIAIPRAPPRAEAWILTCVTTRAASDTRTPARGGCWAIQISAHNRRAQGRRTHTRPQPLLLYGEAEISGAALRCKPRSPPARELPCPGVRSPAQPPSRSGQFQAPGAAAHAGRPRPVAFVVTVYMTPVRNASTFCSYTSIS